MGMPMGALFAVLFFAYATKLTFQVVPLWATGPPVQSGESITTRLAPCNAAEVVLPYGRLKPFDVLHHCQDDRHRNTFNDVVLFQSSLGPPLLKIDSLIPSKSGFVSTLMQAYNGHHNLIIRPDDVWLSILARFNTYVNQNVEELRYKFVTHEGKKSVEVKIKGKNRYSYNWGTLGQTLVEAMDRYLSDESLRPWILPNFSTTTELDTAVASAVMLSTFKGYFNYRIIFSCGIPSVTLMGTRADWVSVLHRVEMLHNFDVGSTGLRKQTSTRKRKGDNQGDIMAQWQHRLEVVLKRFIAMFDREESEEFWSQIFTATPYGSGGQRSLSGWVTAFATYEPNLYCGNYYELDGVRFGCLDVADLPVDVAEVPIQIDDHGYKVMGLLVAGVLGARKINSTTIGPERAWWMFENKTAGWIE